MSSKSHEALQWISNLLNKHEVPYMICGGLAAIGYGSTRPLNDIDLFVPDEYFQTVVDAGAEYISKPAKRYTGYGWDIEYVQFIYKGTKIEVGNVKEARILDSKVGEWVPLSVDFSRLTRRVVLGVDVPLMAIADLVDYKKVLGREVDIEDVDVLEQL